MSLRVSQFDEDKTDVFLTHAWGNDEEGRDNHARVQELNQQLKTKGYTTWFDSDRMIGDIVEQMCDGIDNASVIIVCVTKRYMTKIASKGQDNCKKEFSYSVSRKGSAKMVTVVMEPCMQNTSLWTGRLAMELGGNLYVDMSNSTSKNMQHLCDEIDTRLGKKTGRKIKTQHKPKKNQIAPAPAGRQNQKKLQAPARQFMVNDSSKIPVRELAGCYANFCCQFANVSVDKQNKLTVCWFCFYCPFWLACLQKTAKPNLYDHCGGYEFQKDLKGTLTLVRCGVPACKICSC